MDFRQKRKSIFIISIIPKGYLNRPKAYITLRQQYITFP